MAANVLIDVEVLYYLSRNEQPLHRYLHTYLGGSAAGLLAGLLGGLSHVFLDSLMHADMHPLWPFTTGNQFAGSVSVAALHVTLGLIGLFALILWLMLREPE